MIHSSVKLRYTFCALTLKAGYLIVIVLFFASCEQNSYVTLNGKTMGTYYSIQYRSINNYQREIDSILQNFISAASTYDSASEISEFNRAGSIVFKTPCLFQMLSAAREIHLLTGGAFEPTLMPVINAHGFGYEKVNIESERSIDSLMSLVSFGYLTFDSVKLTTKKKGVQLDLSAMGEGFAIELISDFLEQQNIHNYKVEIGGEMKCKGKNPKNELWLVAIEDPSLNNEMRSYVRLQDAAISTSGNYRKFRAGKNGSKKSHIIDPKTGESIENNLLSVTIINENATFADAIATSCMVMGFNSAKTFLTEHRISGFLIYHDEGKLFTWKSSEIFDERISLSK